MVGQIISHYRVLNKLGQGGIGVVYRAEDTKLARLVALKFLPAHLLHDEAIHERFEREAKSAAALSHPNVCRVYEIDQADGETFIAMELLEGEALNKRIERGPLKLDEALDVARQVAQGLSAAHEKGIYHRDIKPENLMADAKGHVTIMDFGLAQLAQASRLTKANQTLGTIAYMSPEQANATATDHRTDIWALGVVLYEMITGQRPFKGDYDPAILYSILNEEPAPITGLRTGVPMELERLVGKCLAKDAGRRYQHADELGVDLEALAGKLKSGKSRVVQGPPPSEMTVEDAALARSRPLEDAARESRGREARSRRFSLGLLAAVLLLSGVVAAMWLQWPEAATKPPLRKFAFTMDAPVVDVVISPNGRYIAYIRADPAFGPLWIHDLERGEAREIDGAPISYEPFWSPDSEFVGFSTVAGELRKVSVRGGGVITLCDLPLRSWGGSWSQDGESIVFSMGRPARLYEVSARGGTPAQLIEPEPEQQGNYLVRPHSLASDNGGRTMVFAIGGVGATDVMLNEPGGGPPALLVPGDGAVFSSTGHLVYEGSRGAGGIWALPFSLATLKPVGEAFPIRQEASDPSVARDGTLAYLEVRHPGRQQLLWRDRQGIEIGKIGQPQDAIQFPSISPDGRRVAVLGYQDEDGDVWIHDVRRPIKTRLTFTPGRDYSVRWSPTSNEIIFRSEPGEGGALFTTSADGSSEAKEFFDTPGRDDNPHDWSRDGRRLIFHTVGSDTTRDLWYLERKADGSWSDPVEFLITEFEERVAVFLPEARFVAYVSDESGRDEIYVRPFPSGGGKWQVSESGGTQPRWSRDGREIFYVESDTLIAVSVNTKPTFSVGSTERLFSDPGLAALFPQQTYDVAADGQRFVMVENLGDPQYTIHVMQNWYEEFRDRE